MKKNKTPRSSPRDRSFESGVAASVGTSGLQTKEATFFSDAQEREALEVFFLAKGKNGGEPVEFKDPNDPTLPFREFGEGAPEALMPIEGYTNRLSHEEAHELLNSTLQDMYAMDPDAWDGLPDIPVLTDTAHPPDARSSLLAHALLFALFVKENVVSRDLPAELFDKALGLCNRISDDQITFEKSLREFKAQIDEVNTILPATEQYPVPGIK